MAATLARLSHRHEAICNWLLANPDRSLGDCAAFFGYTQPWLSQLIHSDMFQAMYMDRAQKLGVAVVHTMRDAVAGATALALQKTVEKLADPLKPPSESFVRDTTKFLLTSMGYVSAQTGPPAATNVTVQVAVTGQALIEARERAMRKQLEAAPNGVGEGFA